jgi:hypothetical protein
MYRAMNKKDQRNCNKKFVEEKISGNKTLNKKYHSGIKYVKVMVDGELKNKQFKNILLGYKQRDYAAEMDDLDDLNELELAD